MSCSRDRTSSKRWGEGELGEEEEEEEEEEEGELGEEEEGEEFNFFRKDTAADNTSGDVGQNLKQRIKTDTFQ